MQGDVLSEIGVQKMKDILSVKDLYVKFNTLSGVVKAVNGVNLSIKHGRAVGLVGETGAGKTTTALSILGMIPVPPGDVRAASIVFNGRDIKDLPVKELQKIRGKQISMIFQDPMGSLNPVYTSGQQIMEVIRLHQNVTSKEAYDIAVSMLKKVGLTESVMSRYPYELSGGMKQRVMIAIALACQPELLIADEPTTALDVTIQAQVIELMKEIKTFYSGAILLITHDLGLVADLCDEVAVMYAGQIIEYGNIADVYKSPFHPYTKRLFKSTPRLDIQQDKLEPIPGLSPDPRNLPSGCLFHDRCDFCMDKCIHEAPEVIDLSENHKAKCWLLERKSDA